MITVLQLFELAESLVADYEDPELQSWRREFAAMAAKERKGTLLARDVMVAMALEAIGGLYDYAEISDAVAPSPGDQTPEEQ